MSKKIDITKLGGRIQYIRKVILKLNQTDFAKKLGLESASAISYYESGGREPEINILVKIRELSKVDLNWLLSGEEIKSAPVYSEQEQDLINDLLKILHGKNKANADAIIWNVKAFARTSNIDVDEEEKPPFDKNKSEAS